MTRKYRILAINPGSTSTKIALFDNFKKLFDDSIAHTYEELSVFASVQDQLEFRTEVVEQAMVERGFAMEDVDAFSGRGGGLVSVASGVYTVTDLVCAHASTEVGGMQHPAQLASQICKKYADKYGKLAFIVNPPDTDEFCDIARITGIKGLYRESHLHALNQKETALRFCDERGLKYKDVNLILCHIGGGTSITAHHKGKMIDSNDIIKGSGPMSPNRAGDLPYVSVIDMAYSGEYTKKELLHKLNTNGGLMDYFGTQDIRDVLKLIRNGDEFAQTVLDGMVYQIAKYVGSMAAALRGQVDAIILTGGISNNEEFTVRLIKYIDWISEIEVMPGEFEMEALAAGAVRVLRGKLKAKEYTGIPVWTGFANENK